ncbi:MoaD/ThiS family protein, partial [Candidatus Hodarchaeum mangrovi]
QDLLNQLGIEREQAKIIMINGVGITDVYYILKENDEVAIFPPVGGG